MMVSIKPIYEIKDNKNIIFPDTPIDLLRVNIKDISRYKEKANDYRQNFIKKLSSGVVDYTKRTHDIVNLMSNAVWGNDIISYLDSKGLPNPYKSLDKILYNILGDSKDKITIAFVGRSSVPYLIHTFGRFYREGRIYDNILIYITTKWEKSGRMISANPTTAIYYDIKNIMNKKESKRLIIVDDVLSTGYTATTILNNARKIMGREVEINVLPVYMDLAKLILNNLSNDGRNITNYELAEFIDNIEDYYLPMDKKSIREFFTVIKRYLGHSISKTNKKDLEVLLSSLYPGVVVSSGIYGETFPLTHFIRDTIEYISMKNLEIDDKYNKIIDDINERRAKGFDEPLAITLGEIEPYIYHAPRSL